MTRADILERARVNRERAHEMRLAGATVARIARVLDVPTVRAYRLLASLPEHTSGVIARRVAMTRAAEARRMRAEGKTLREIGAHFRRSTSWAWHHVRSVTVGARHESDATPLAPRFERLLRAADARVDYATLARRFGFANRNSVGATVCMLRKRRTAGALAVAPAREEARHG